MCNYLITFLRETDSTSNMYIHIVSSYQNNYNHPPFPFKCFHSRVVGQGVDQVHNLGQDGGQQEVRSNFSFALLNGGAACQ